MATIQTWKTKYGTSYRASIYVQGRRESATFDSRAKALAWAEETAALLRSGQPLPGELPANDLRLNEAVEKYTMAVAPRKKRNTQRLDQEIGGRRGGPGNLDKPISGKSATTTAQRWAQHGAENGKRNQTEAFSGIQSKSGLGSDSGRQNFG